MLILNMPVNSAKPAETIDYFIVYKISDATGNIQIKSEKEIKNIEQIRGIETYIKSKIFVRPDSNRLVIINLQRLPI